MMTASLRPFRILILSLPLLLGKVESICAQAPPRLSIEAAERLILDGDRLAGQADYVRAVEKYTEAYLGIVSKIRGQEYLSQCKTNADDSN